MRWILDAINVVENWWTRATEEKNSLILAEAPADDKKAARNEHLLSFKRAFDSFQPIFLWIFWF